MATELLKDYAIHLSPFHVRRIRHKRRVCKLNGHLFTATSYDDATGEAVLECQRCWPHKDSILTATLYDLMPKVQETEQ